MYEEEQDNEIFPEFHQTVLETLKYACNDVYVSLKEIRIKKLRNLKVCSHQ